MTEFKKVLCQVEWLPYLKHMDCEGKSVLREEYLPVCPTQKLAEKSLTKRGLTKDIIWMDKQGLTLGGILKKYHEIGELH